MSTALSAPPARWQDAADEEVRVEAVPTDAALLARVGRGAEAGFAEVVRRHSGPLYAVAYRQLQSAADAEEIVQDAFLLLWRKRSRVHLLGDSALPSLIVMVKHLSANRRRARARRATHEGAVRPPAPIALDEGTAVADLLARAFAALPPLDSAVARLCLEEDVTYAEAAARLGLTEGAVRNRLSRARARLRKDLEEDR